ncbi:DUF308 domain-containing protein [uncultured Ferrimonas sp.]|uniref:DUF308 domain-containing protein n=1 Tax=uncultured Ferrimonas sp. TaxID=432640 RepID=UPI002608DA60|nr:DUF308 domain-containing protein [uncultured Ferrimonas sp.]
MKNSSGRSDHTFDRLAGIALLVVGGISMLSPDFSSQVLEKLFALGLLGGGIYFMVTSEGALKIIGAIMLLFTGGSLLVNGGAGIGVMTLAIGLYFCYSGWNLMKQSEGDEEGKWLRLNGTVTLLLGVMALWQWGDATTTALGVIVGLKLLMLGVYHNTKANLLAKAA